MARKTAVRLLSAALGLLMCILSGCSAAVGGVLKVGVKGDVTNFSLYDEESGRYAGLEIDLARQLAADMGYGDVEFVTVNTSDRESLLNSGDIDLIIATYTVTEERKTAFGLSEPYYTDYVSVMVEASSLIEEMKDLRGCRVGVMRNSTNALALADYLAENGIIASFDAAAFSPEDFTGGVTFVPFDSYAAISDALEQGDVDAFLADHSILNGYKKDDRLILSPGFAPQEYAVCTRAGTALARRVYSALHTRLTDGTVDALIEKWGN